MNEQSYQSNGANYPHLHSLNNNFHAQCMEFHHLNGANYPHLLSLNNNVPNQYTGCYQSNGANYPHFYSRNNNFPVPNTGFNQSNWNNYPHLHSLNNSAPDRHTGCYQPNGANYPHLLCHNNNFPAQYTGCWSPHSFAYENKAYYEQDTSRNQIETSSKRIITFIDQIKTSSGKIITFPNQIEAYSKQNDTSINEIKSNLALNDEVNNCESPINEFPATQIHKSVNKSKDNPKLNRRANFYFIIPHYAYKVRCWKKTHKTTNHCPIVDNNNELQQEIQSNFDDVDEILDNKNDHSLDVAVKKEDKQLFDDESHNLMEISSISMLGFDIDVIISIKKRKQKDARQIFEPLIQQIVVDRIMTHKRIMCHSIRGRQKRKRKRKTFNFPPNLIR